MFIFKTTFDQLIMTDFSGKVQPLTQEDHQNINNAYRSFKKLENPTWNDFANLINTNPNCTKDEGSIHPYSLINPETHKPFNYGNTPIYNEKLDAVIAFWVRGGSEGYYVHVRPIESGENMRYDQLGKPEMVGKFWGIETAQACTNFIQEMANRLF